jgi:single-strand DNA-binding protein
LSVDRLCPWAIETYKIEKHRLLLSSFSGQQTLIMYRLKNKVQLIGHLSEDPCLCLSENGKKSAKFRMATSETYRNLHGEKVTETQWHNLIGWGKIADIVEKYLCKGSEVAIEGKLVNRLYVDKCGSKKCITEVHINELLILGNRAA